MDLTKELTDEAKLLKILTLQIQAVMVNARISPQSLQMANFDFTAMVINNQYLTVETKLIARMAGQKVQTYKHPKTWRDAFKERWFPAFLKKRYPIEYVKLETWECYPEYRLPDKLGQPIQFFLLDNETYDKIKE